MGDLEAGQARVRHPDLGEQVVAASQVEHLKLSGWDLVEGDADEWPDEVKPFGGQPTVRIYHPGLDRYETVPASAVPQHRSQDWVLADEAEAASLEGKTVPELRDLAKDRGIKPIPTTKPDLLDALSAPVGTDQPEQDQAGGEPAPSEEDEG